jgi:DNA-binding NtrC family response regulator
MIMKSDETTKVLVSVSDSPVRQQISGWFEDNGYDPVEITNLESINAQACHNARLVISDVNNTEVDTGRLIQAVKAVQPNLPVVLVTASDAVNAAVGFLVSGATDFLLKPINRVELSVKVARAIKERELKDESATLRGSKTSNPVIDSMANPSQEIKTLQRIEREAIVKTLDGFGGARGKTAKALGISVRTLQRKIKEYGYTNSGAKPDSSLSAAGSGNALNN